MCGRYVLAGIDKVLERYNISHPAPQLEPQYNVAPSATMPVVIRPDGQNELVFMRWGLVPRWSKDGSSGPINARAETVAEKPMFRDAFRHRRCLIPATGFYEWHKVGKAKEPFYIHLTDEEIFSLAGLYEVWTDAEGQEHPTYTIVTTTANETMAPIHQRMPVIIPRSDEAVWLDRQLEDPAELQSLLQPYPDAGMEAYRISDLVNQPRNNTPDLIQPRLDGM